MLAAAFPNTESRDLQALKALVIALHERYTRTLSSCAGEMERPLLLVATLIQVLSGRKGEQVLRHIGHREFQLGNLQPAGAVEEVQAALPAERTTTAKPRRRSLRGHLPRAVQTHMAGRDVFPDCGGRLTELGEDVAEMLKNVSASFKVLRHVRPQVSSDSCRRVLQASAPSRYRLYLPRGHAKLIGKDAPCV